MVNVQINETDLLDLFMNRLEYWTNDGDTLELYEDYLESLIDNGCFEGANLEVNTLIDDLYINDTSVMDGLELASNGIDYDNCDKILARIEDKDLYLVSNY